MINGKTKVLAIFGNPVDHSRSPELQNKWINEEKQNWVYVPFKVDDIEIAVKAIKKLNFLGANVTIPYKLDCMKWLDKIDSTANSVGAVNTIVNENGYLIGYNTDVIGFQRDIEDEIKDSKNILIYGAGGASKAAITALKNLNKKITIVNRTNVKAEKLAKEFDISSSKLDDLDKSKIEVIVNCSSQGMDGNSVALDLTDFTRLNFVYDMIYEPSVTPLLKVAKEKAIKCKNGFGMLVGQGRAAFGIWQNADLIQ